MEKIKMVKIAKVVISLPEDMLSDIEKERKARGESRSEFVQKAVEKVLKDENESSAVKDYIQGYKRMPEISEEIERALQAATAVLSEVPRE